MRRLTRRSAGTTKGTGGDILILEEAAYVDCDFFYETVAPLLLVGVTSLICISTLTSDIKCASLAAALRTLAPRLEKKRRA